MTIRNSMGKLAALVAVVSATSLLNRPVSAQTINGAGATFPQPIYQKWFQAYSEAHSGVQFNYNAVGSGQGIAQYTAGTVDFGATDAPMSDADLAKVPVPTLHIPTVAGSVVLAYNLRGLSGLKLSGDVLADIYLGKIKRWNDPRIAGQNPGLKLPSQGITVVHRADGSGTTYIFTSYLAEVSPEWKAGPGVNKTINWPVGIAGQQTAGVAGLIKQQPGTIGYVEIAYALQARLQFAALKNASGAYVVPSLASTTAAADAAVPKIKKDVRVAILNGAGPSTYPIASFTYLLIPKTIKDPAKGKALVGFLTWAMGPGQAQAAALNYAALPKSIAALNLKAISQIHVGP